ncbi:hypothetical protein [Spirosoma arcticum]
MPDSYGVYPDSFRRPSFILPDKIPAGRYLFRLQYKKENGSTAIGEPLERDVIVE